MRRLKISKMISASRLLLLSLVAVLSLGTTAIAQTKASKMTKQERVHLRNGNQLYEKNRYAEAEAEYKKALQANPTSEKAQFNLATALMRQGNITASKDDKNNPINQAEELLTNLAKGAQDKQLRGKACYDLGNIAYGRQQYDQAIDFYKHALRCNPDDDQARQNLRLAQLKKQQQDQNKDKNKDNKDNQDQNKDQNKDKDQDNNKDQNKDKQDQNKDNQNQDKQNQDKQNQDKQQGGMSQQNAEQVLKAMQDRERATQQRINAQQAQQQRHERQRTNKKW